IGGRGLGRQRDRRRAGREQARDLALDIMRELAGAGLGEIDAVIGAELADLAFEVGALLQEEAALVHEAVPDIDIGDAGLAGGFELGVGHLVVGLGLGLALRLGVRRLVVGRLVISRLVRRLAAGVLLRVFLVRRFFLVFVLVALFGHRLAQRHAVVDAEHD